MDPKKPAVDKDIVPDVDDRANQSFLDQLIDTNGRPMRDAVDMPDDAEDDEEDL